MVDWGKWYGEERGGRVTEAEGDESLLVKAVEPDL